MMVKSGLDFFILKFTKPLQSCCCPVPKNLPIRAELAWQVRRYLWRGSVNFKINSRPLFTIIFKAKNVNFKTRDFSPLIEWVLAGVSKESQGISRHSRNLKESWEIPKNHKGVLKKSRKSWRKSWNPERR